MTFYAKTTLTITILFFSIKTFGQKYEPTILILYPNETLIDKKLEGELQDFNKNMKKSKNEMDKQHKELLEEVEEEAENIRFMVNKKIEFENEFDLYSLIPAISESMLQYRFSQRFKDLKIYAIREKSNGSIEELSVIAEKHKMQYVLNFPKVNSFKKINGKFSTIRIQLYDNAIKKIVIDKEFTGNDVNNGFENTCDEGSLFCTFSNSLAQSWGELIKYVAENNQTLKSERELYSLREDVLENDYLKKKIDEEVLEIISKNSLRPTVDCFQTIKNDDKTKFVAFFATNDKKFSSKDKDSDEDKNVNIISNSNNDFSFEQNTYTYVIIGLNYNSKWYFKKVLVTYFDAKDLDQGKATYFNNLQKLNFFKENSTEFNPEFWETNFFEKVEDVTKKPDYKKYYESIYKRQERENEGYVGMYRIVVDELKKNESKKIEEFEGKMKVEVFTAFYESQKSKKINDIADYYLFKDELTFIFPKTYSVVLNPIKIKDNNGNFSLRYFVYLPEKKEFYEWTYLKPFAVKEKDVFYNSFIVEQISLVTEWDFGFETLDNQSFWDDFVLLKEGEHYKYLKKIDSN